MSLRDLDLKLQYRTDRDNLVTEFFIPCLSNSIQYDRAVEYVTLKSVSILSLGLQNLMDHGGKIRLVTGHRYKSSDLDILSRLYNQKSRNGNGKTIQNEKIALLQNLIQNEKVQIKIAIPNSEIVDGSFSERIGIFYDGDGNTVAYTGTSNETFNTENRNFESVDVFTSWDDKGRVEIKKSDFERLWNNQTNYVQVHDFRYAEAHGLLKYDPSWAVETIS